MIRTDRRLAFAFALSLLAHLLPFLPGWRPRPANPPPPPLQAALRPPPPAAAPPLMLPEASAPPHGEPPPPKAKPVKPAPPAAGGWQREIQRQFSQQQQRGEFYPAEAIALGVQGEALVLLLLASDGSVEAARLEQSSGHALLDAAALRAVRALHSLPADAPRETVIPVRFRLR